MLHVSLALGRVRVLVTARVAGVGLRDPPDLALQRGREQQRLALWSASSSRSCRRPGGSPCRASGRPRPARAAGCGASDDVATVDQVEQPSRCRHEDVRARRQPRLLDDSGAAVHRRDRQRAGVCDRAQLIDDLDRELARGREDERRGPCVGVLQALDQPAPRTRASCPIRSATGPARRGRRACRG